MASRSQLSKRKSALRTKANRSQIKVKKSLTGTRPSDLKGLKRLSNRSNELDLKLNFNANKTNKHHKSLKTNHKFPSALNILQNNSELPNFMNLPNCVTPEIKSSTQQNFFLLNQKNIQHKTEMNTNKFTNLKLDQLLSSKDEHGDESVESFYEDNIHSNRKFLIDSIEKSLSRPREDKRKKQRESKNRLIKESSVRIKGGFDITKKRRTTLIEQSEEDSKEENSNLFRDIYEANSNSDLVDDISVSDENFNSVKKDNKKGFNVYKGKLNETDLTQQALEESLNEEYNTGTEFFNPSADIKSNFGVNETIKNSVKSIINLNSVKSNELAKYNNKRGEEQQKKSYFKTNLNVITNKRYSKLGSNDKRRHEDYTAFEKGKQKTSLKGNLNKKRQGFV